MTPDEASKILMIAAKIRNSSVIDKPTHFANIYSHFKSKYPLLFDMCCDPKFEIDILKYMLEKMQMISSGEISTNDSDVEVGQKLFDHYVASVVDVEKLKRKDA